MSEIPAPPDGSSTAAGALWNEVMGAYELEDHERALLVEAVRTMTLLDELDRIVRSDGAIIKSPHGDKAHPAAVEARQQRITLARLLAAIRLPMGDEDDSKQPQRRTGFRGTYGPRGVA